MVSIIQKDNPLLRKKAEVVSPSEISTKHIQTIIKNMKVALSKEKDGVAIAAPQIGESLRIFVVSGRAFKIKDSQDTPFDTTYINPEIISLSKKRKTMEEGCLSVRYLYGEISRAEKATVKAFDENGLKFERGGSGLLAQIFQHEIDHLNGILFIDKAKNLGEHPPEESPPKSGNQ